MSLTLLARGKRPRCGRLTLYASATPCRTRARSRRLCATCCSGAQAPSTGFRRKGVHMNVLASNLAILAVMLSAISSAHADASDVLPVSIMLSAKPISEPIANSAFTPGPHTSNALEFVGALQIAQSSMQAKPAIEHPIQDGRDGQLFPGVTLEFFTMNGILVPVQRGEMVRETATVKVASYWRVIPQFGRVWKESGDGRWSRAAFPIMLVNDTENHAHQGLATFLYRPGEVTGLVIQFVQQTGPYLIKQYFVAWGFAPADFAAGDASKLEGRVAQARAELADRLPARPWSELLKT